MKKLMVITWLLLNLFSIPTTKGSSHISGRLPFLKKGDSVSLRICAYGVHSFFTTPLNRELISKVNDHAFRFDIGTTSKPGYFTITFLSGQVGRFINGNYFLEDGDDIHIDDVNSINYVHFTGKGSEKLNVIYQLAQIAQYYLRQYPEPQKGRDLAGYFAGQDSLCKAQLAYLNERASFLSQTAFILIRSDIMSRNMGKVNMVDLLEKLNKAGQTASSDYERYHDPFAKELNSAAFRQNPYLPYAERFHYAVLAKYKFDSCRVIQRLFDTAQYYHYLKRNFSGMLRERLVTSFLYENRDAPFDLSKMIVDATGFVKNDEFLRLLYKLKRQRIKGVMVEDFAMADTAGIIQHLSQLKGKVVVLDIWFTGCGFCINAAGILKRVGLKFAQNNTVAFVSICEDKNRNSWMSSVRSGRYTSDRELNLYTMGLGEQHPFIKHYDIQGSTILVIDKSGKMMNNPANILMDNGASLESLILEGLAGH